MPWTEGPSPGRRYHFYNGPTSSPTGSAPTRRCGTSGRGATSRSAAAPRRASPSTPTTAASVAGWRRPIEPYPEGLFLSLSPRRRRGAHEARAKPAPGADIAPCGSSRRGDVLSIDSTHRLEGAGQRRKPHPPEILAGAAPGGTSTSTTSSPVRVSEADLRRPRWQEDYLLRAFLEYNPVFEIGLFNTFLEHFHRDGSANTCRSASRIQAAASGSGRRPRVSGRAAPTDGEVCATDELARAARPGRRGASGAVA